MNVKQVIKERRAFRSLDPIEISGDLIKNLAEIPQIAFSCANNQSWNFFFVYDQEQLEGIFTTVNIGKHSKTINPVFSGSMELGEKQRPPKKKLEEFAYMNSYIIR
ncbi:MAG: hypothetical protein ACFFEY_15030 [Candidatus Thorarchaeota archaeon]